MMRRMPMLTLLLATMVMLAEAPTCAVPEGWVAQSTATRMHLTPRGDERETKISIAPLKVSAGKLSEQLVTNVLRATAASMNAQEAMEATVASRDRPDGKAHWVDCAVATEKVRSRLRVAVVTSGESAALVVLVCDPETFEAHLPAMNLVMDTFEMRPKSKD